MPVSNRVTSIDILTPPNSDHAPIQVKLSTPYWTPHTHISRREVTDFTKADWTKFQEELDTRLENIDYNTTADIDTCDNNILNSVKQAKALSIPTKTIKINPNRNARPLPTFVLNAIKIKRRAHRLYMRTRTDDNRRLYRRMQEEVKAAISIHKNILHKKFTSNLENLSSENPKSFWQKISKLRGKKNFTNHPIKDGNNVIFDDEGKAELFRQKLQEIYRIPRSPKFDEEHLQDTENFVNNHPFLFRPLTNAADFPPDLTLFTSDDVKQAVRKLRNTTPGPDGIQNIIWKKLSEKAYSLLAKFFSASFHFGYIPPRWKEAHILMFPKAHKNPGDVNSYRPISLTNTISKLMEKIVVTKFTTLIQNSLPPSQAGFRPGIEITDQLLRVFTPIENATEKNFAAVIAALDVRKAFDTMWHDGLRLKLTQLNFPICLTRWISNFLQDRTAKVKYNSTLSDNIRMEAGAPQGSAISPTLYNLFVYDIPQPDNDKIGLAQFADDTCIWVINPQVGRACRTMNRQLDTYLKWTQTWRITINADKTQTMLIKKKHKRRHVIEANPIIIDNTRIPFTKTLTYLGITLTDRIHLTPHINQIMTRTIPICKTITFLSRNNTHMTSNTRTHLYKTIMRATLTHAAPFLLHMTPTQKLKLLRKERRTLRTCLQLPPNTPNRIVHPLANLDPFHTHIEQLSRKYYTRASSKPYTRHLLLNPPPKTTALLLKNLT